MKFRHVAGGGILISVIGVGFTAAFWFSFVYGVFWILQEFGVLRALGVE